MKCAKCCHANSSKLSQSYMVYLLHVQIEAVLWQDLKKLVSQKYDIQSFPVVVECDINGAEEVLGGWKELKIALEYKDECKGCKENKKV